MLEPLLEEKKASSSKRKMQTIKEINNIMKIKIADMNCDIEAPKEIQSRIDEEHPNIMNVDKG